MKVRRKKQENLDFEIEFLEKLIQKDPNYVDALYILGELYTRKKKYNKALEIDLKLAELKPEDPIVFYNLACDYSLLNKKTLGLKALEKAFKLGYDDIEYIFKDPDMKNLRESKRFYQMLEKYRRKISSGLT
jgi:tetratricopeptide (TPR) repeat protein